MGKIRHFVKAGANIKIDTKNLKIITTEDIDVNGEPTLVDENGETYIQADMTRVTSSMINGDPSTIVGIYKDSNSGMMSARSRIISNMTEEERKAYTVWTFEVHGFKDYARLKAIEIWVDDKLHESITEDGTEFVYIKKKSVVKIKLVDADEWQKYAYKNGVFEVRDIGNDVLMLQHGAMLEGYNKKADDPEGLPYATEVEMDLQEAVHEDRHFRFYYFDLKTFLGCHFGLEPKTSLVFPKKDYDAGKNFIWKDLGFCSSCRLQTDLLQFRLYDGETYDQITDIIHNTGSSNVLDDWYDDAPLPEDMRVLGYNVDPTDKGYAKWDIQISPRAVGKKFAFYIKYGRICYCRPFEVALEKGKEK